MKHHLGMEKFFPSAGLEHKNAKNAMLIGLSLLVGK